MPAFTRDRQLPDTFGMASRVARRVHARHAGRLAAEQGRGSGPCPAVALATLTGWSYARAERYLRDYGFTGRGMCRPVLLRALTDLLGPPRRPDLCGRFGTTVAAVAAAVQEFAYGQDGVVFCKGHVMPVRNGRVLNAGQGDLGKPCEDLYFWDIQENT